MLTDDPQFPAWWTSNPLRFPMLTGWAASHYARAFQGQTQEQMIETALQSLARILETGREDVASKLVRGLVHDWQSDPFACGGYSYVTVGGMGAERALAEPLANTLFFAGEATHFGGHNGTVHGAIATGIRAGKQVLEKLT
jgi:monoamine oxidase